MHVPAWATSGRYFHLPSMTLAAVILGVSVVGMHSDGFQGTGVYDLRALALTLVRVDDPVLLIVVVVATLLVCGWAGQVMGARRMFFAYIGGGLITSAVGLLVGELEKRAMAALPLNSELTGGANPVAALLVVATAASCFTGALWRRRIRLVGVLVAVTLFLYAASAGDLYALVALPVGIAVGMFAGGARATSGVQRSSHHETRVLLTALTTVVAVGPVIATVWGSGAGLLSSYGWLSYDPLVLADGTVCAPGSFAAPCPEGATSDELQPNAGWIAAIPLAVLLVAAWGILRGRRSALWVAIGMNILMFAGTAYLFIASEPDRLALFAEVQGVDSAFAWQTLIGLVVGAIVPLGVALTLLLCRRAVTVRSTKKAQVAFVRTVVLAAAGVSVTTFVCGLALSPDFMPRPSGENLFGAIPLRLLPPSLVAASAVTYVPTTAAAQALWYLPSLLFWSTCVGGTLKLVVTPRRSSAPLTGFVSTRWCVEDAARWDTWRPGRATSTGSPQMLTPPSRTGCTDALPSRSGGRSEPTATAPTSGPPSSSSAAETGGHPLSTASTKVSRELSPRCSGSVFGSPTRRPWTPRRGRPRARNVRTFGRQPTAPNERECMRNGPRGTS